MYGYRHRPETISVCTRLQIAVQHRQVYPLRTASLGIQGHKARRAPLIVHACTSSQNFMTTGQFFQHIQAYFTSHPPPFRVILGAYPKYQGRNIVHTKQMLAARSALAEAKFVAICTGLRISGRERLAKKLYAGWKVMEQRLQYICTCGGHMFCCMSVNLHLVPAVCAAAAASCVGSLHRSLHSLLCMSCHQESIGS